MSSSNRPQILIVDDEKNIRRSVSLLLEDAGYEVNVAEDAIRALEKIRTSSFDLVVLDIHIGEINGLQLFQKIRDEKILVPVLFMSGNASLSEAVATVKMGGADFLEKPFEPEQLLIAVARTLKLGELEKQLNELRNLKQTGSSSNEMIGQSNAITQLLEAIKKAAPTRSKIFIQGETGTGKELIARAIHRMSHLADGPFIKVNCAAIPSELIESELFGHERGSFTGANQLKRGLFELAHRGTIFLDEIGEMSPSAQAKVLRVLQNQEFTRVGGSQTIKVDVRVISASHRDLAQEVKDGKFREDLFFRINVVPLFSEPLRSRKDDIPILTQKFLEESCKENGFAPKNISPEAVDQLMQYSWPGNVRELKNLIERIVIFSGETIDLADLPPHLSQTIRSPALPETGVAFLTLEDFKKKSEREYLILALKSAQGNVTQAAKALDLERTYLHRKIQDFAILKKEYF